MRIAKAPQTPQPVPAQARPATGPMAERAAQSPAVHRLHTLQRRATAPVQRVLAHNSPIVGAEVASVTALAAKVFLLRGNNGDSVIIKFEMAGGGETADTFATRDAYTRALGTLVLTGVPNAQALSGGDLTAIRGLTAPPVTGDIQDLQRAIAAPLPLNMLVLKAQKVDVGLNVQAEMDAATKLMKKGGKNLNRGMSKSQALNAALSQPAMVQSMGRMAAFDMMVNNYDRFRPEGDVNLVNLDIGGGAALGIDNLNPWDPLVAGAWQGGPHLAGPQAMQQYAARVVGFLLDKLGMDPSGSRTMVQHFMQGMINAIRTMKAYEPTLRIAIAAENNQDKINVMTILADRLQQLPAV